METIEAVVLTGGSSRRMGQDKSTIIVDGQPLAGSIAKELKTICTRVVVLGNDPIEGFEFLPDTHPDEGPLTAIAEFKPSASFVFVASCDLVRFSAKIVADLRDRIGAHQTAIPDLNGRLQPLCALYRADCFDALPGLVSRNERRIMVWVKSLDILAVQSAQLSAEIRTANTPEELARALEP